jgi:hypothetical protein
LPCDFVYGGPLSDRFFLKKLGGLGIEIKKCSKVIGKGEQRPLDVPETANRQALNRLDLLAGVAAAAVARGSASLLRLGIPAVFAADPPQKTETISPKTWLDVDEENNVIETESLKIGYGPYYWQTAVLRKWDRVYKKTPVLEIEYEQHPFVDFTDIVMPGEDPCSFALCVYGTKRDLTHAKYKEIASVVTALPDHTGLEGHFLKYFFDYAGADMNACVYKKHQIWGIRDEKTKIGIGFVAPAVREWETWVNGGGINYYCYQFYRATREAFPKQFKRWVFAFQGSRENCFAMGRDIVDNGGPLSWPLIEATTGSA